MTTKTLEQFDVMDEQALAAVEGGGYWDDYPFVGAAAGVLLGTGGYLLQNYADTDVAPGVNFW